jgi:hypothetical protein
MQFSKTNKNLMAKKLSELIGSRNTQEETWQKIRAELRDDIAAAFKLAFEYEGCAELGRRLGLTEAARFAAIEMAVSGPIVASPDFLLLRLQQLKDIASVPPQAFDFFQLVLNKFAHEYGNLAGKIVASAIPIAEGELKAAIATEAQFFSDVGLARQETSLAQGVVSVIAKLKSYGGHFVRKESPNFPQLPPPGTRILPELFADEAAKQAKALEEIASEKNLSA